MNAAVLRCSRPSAVVFHPVAVHTHSSTEMWRVSLFLGHFQTDDRGQTETVENYGDHRHQRHHTRLSGCWKRPNNVQVASVFQFWMKGGGEEKNKSYLNSKNNKGTITCRVVTAGVENQPEVTGCVPEPKAKTPPGKSYCNGSECCSIRFVWLLSRRRRHWGEEQFVWIKKIKTTNSLGRQTEPVSRGDEAWPLPAASG